MTVAEAPPKRKRRESSRTCSVDGCERPVSGVGMCQLHRRRQRLFGSPDIVLRPHRYADDARCAVRGCPDRPRARGLCARHGHVATWRDLHCHEWSELAGLTWDQVRAGSVRPNRRDGARSNGYRSVRGHSDKDPDTPLLELGRSALRAGWPEDLVAWFIPRLYTHWPGADLRQRDGDRTHEAHTREWYEAAPERVLDTSD